MANLKVSQLSKYIENLVKRDSFLSNISIEGEVSNLSLLSNLIFFDLKDEFASLSCIVFSSNYFDIASKLKEGKKIIASGSISIYEKSSKYQLVVREVDDIGQGKIYEEYIKLKNKLDKEGLFNKEYKKPIPIYPNRMGLITSKKGAALHDVLNALERRYPYLHIYFYPVSVQGERAKEEISSALDCLEGIGLDLILITRGGGSFEDLHVFNDEELSRKVFNLKTPTVSAIGHEIDTSIIELVSDIRAATPTEAAEKISPNKMEMVENLINKKSSLDNKIFEKFNSHELELSYIKKELSYNNPCKKIDMEISNLKSQYKLLVYKFSNKFIEYENKLKVLGANLDKHNSKRILEKGFSLVYQNNEIVSSVKKINENDQVKVVLKDGDIKAKLTGKVVYEN